MIPYHPTVSWTETSLTRTALQSCMALAGFIALAFIAPLLSAGLNTGTWYHTLSLPAWAPPGWLFGPVWTALYVLMGIAAWGVWRRRGWTTPLKLWLIQLALNAAWTPLFFALHLPGLAFAELVVLWLAIMATLYAFGQVESWSAWLLTPYLAWVTFAAVLNYEIWRLNS